MEQLEQLFAAIGLNPTKAKEAAGNKKLSASLASVLGHAGVTASNPPSGSAGLLYYELASNILKEPQSLPHLEFLAKRIADSTLGTKDQLSAAIQFCKGKPVPLTEIAEFNACCGVGVVVSKEEVSEVLNKILNDNRAAVQQNGPGKAAGLVMKLVREDPLVKWADGKLVKSTLDTLLPQFTKDLPPVTVEEKKVKQEVPQAAVDPWAPVDYVNDPFFKTGDLGRLHKPGGNPQINKALMELHLKETGGKVLTRFPPEPNGHLHIGHAKAININFGYALANGGNCYLRYDDTNPEAEEEEFFTSITETVEWLGYKPWKITYSSDHFQRLYDLAVFLIKKDLAYVCHCTGEEIHKQRGGEEKGPRFNSPHRDRPVEESLREFQRMKEGYYKEGEATLRMKMDMQNPSPQFWDLVAYRVMYTPHFRSLKDWCIYPTYDYTHCLCDSFENITHSLCTTEFRMSRESYYWLCDAVEVYKPVQWEYGRLNITNTVLSKRKLTQLVQKGIVNGWDDPRLYTLIALRRRGFPPEAINKFVRDCGVTTANTTTDVRRLEFFVRAYLDSFAPRVMAITNPILIYISNLPDSYYEEFDVPYMPRTKSASSEGLAGTRKVPFTNKVYIDASDFKEGASEDPNFFRLSVGSCVGLQHAGVVYCQEIVRGADGKIQALHCVTLTADKIAELGSTVPADRLKPKAHIQWVALSIPTKEQPLRIASPVECEVRMYNDLFLHSNPMDKVEVPGGWLSDINPNSLEIVHGFTEPCVGPFGAGAVGTAGLGLKVESKVQFTRIGYFCVDKDSKVRSEKVKTWVPTLDVASGKVVGKEEELERSVGWVWNRTVGLREDTKKE